MLELFGSTVAAVHAAEKQAPVTMAAAAAEAAVGTVDLGDIKRQVREKMERHRSRSKRKAVRREE